MNTSDLIGFIVIGATALLLVGLSIPLLLGKGTWLIAGYNTMSAEEKARWNGPALARFTGKILLVIGITMPVIGVAGYFNIGWLIWTYLFGLIGLSVFAAVWCNTGKRFRK